MSRPVGEDIGGGHPVRSPAFPSVMKRFLIAVAALVIIGLAVSLGGIIVDEVNRVFWTQSLIWTALSTLVLAPILVFASGSRAKPSGEVAGASSPSPAASSKAASNRTAPFVAKKAASQALSPAVPEPGSRNPATEKAEHPTSGPSKPASSVQASSTPPASTPLSSARTTGARTSVPPESAAPRRPSAPPRKIRSAESEPVAARNKRSTGRTVAYAITGAILAWLGTSLAGIFLDQANLAFWTNSLMWTLLGIILWGPALAFIVNPLAKAESRRQNATSEGTSAPSHSIESKRTDGSELERKVSRTVPESEQVRQAPSSSSVSAGSESASAMPAPSLRTPNVAPPSSEPEWPIWPDDE